MQNGSDHKYDDMLHLPHHVSKTQRRMSQLERAAQFSPFAALTGYDATIQEAGRLTDSRAALTESSKERLDEKLRRIMDEIGRQPEVTVTYFEPDLRKEGGAYVRLTGHVKKIDSHTRAILLTNGMEIPLTDIFDLDSPLFRDMD